MHYKQAGGPEKCKYPDILIKYSVSIISYISGSAVLLTEATEAPLFLLSSNRDAPDCSNKDLLLSLGTIIWVVGGYLEQLQSSRQDGQLKLSVG